MKRYERQKKMYVLSAHHVVVKRKREIASKMSIATISIYEIGKQGSNNNNNTMTGKIQRASAKL